MTQSPPGQRRVDASMSLLNNLMAHPLDEGYAVAARSRPSQGGRPNKSRHRVLLVIALVVLGFLLAVAASQNYRSAPAAEKERNELISRVEQADSRLNDLRDQQTSLADEVRGLQASGLSNSSSGTALQQKLDDLELQAGAVAVTGPGLKAVVDDAKNADKEGRLLDVDLQQLVNGLWTAGAEAISVNGHRLTSLTAIRGAGTAITVDYSSLTPPYTVLAIGDTATMPARFAQSSGGQWVQYLVSNFDVRMTITTEDSLLVPADATIALRHAKVGGPK
ncbi:MAG TPA: DUF881 domain-containing protein [Kribbella sp.]|uniref:DUF881 domain-containing protein n=1 Tax=Kribbella sp. TaxID=1871183 RepID=UPI002D796D6C|nr:DUF881 domain-containing protein [Kribbella sp.]HET6293352.1 DUF881 domain-containing protein [Kribbella sp.]